MEQIFTWCLNHWQILAQLSVTLITLFLLVFKKKVKVNDVMTGLLCVLPEFINNAEATGATGSGKFTLVFQKCLNYLSSVTGQSLDVVTACYATAINDAIENILSTPQKKEVSK